MNDLVSVVVCTYNRAHYLDKCINSLIGQDYPNYEIIIVNGPSTDETVQILEKYPSVRIIQQSKLNGLSYARNLGIKASKGGIIAFIDDDAVADEKWLSYIVQEYSDPGIGAVGGLVYGPQKSHIQFDYGVINKAGIPKPIRDEMAPLGRNEFPILMGTNCSFRKEVLYNIGGFDPYFKYYHDESELCARVVNAGYTIVYNRDAYVIHDMVEGHNRKSPYDLNWSEILKNVIYFTLKNFGKELSSYTIRPMYSLSWWILFFQHHALHGRISLKDLIGIYWQVIRGAYRGYCDGIRLNLKGRKNQDSFLDIEVYEKKNEENLKNGFDCVSPTIKTTGTRLKIAFLSQEYARDCNGGICRYTYDLAHGIANLGHEVHIVAKSENGHEFDYMDEHVHVHKIQPQPVDFLGLSFLTRISRKNLSYSYAACLKLLELTEKNGIQIVEAPLWDAEGFVFSLMKNIPLVVRIETPLFKVAEIQNWSINKDLKLANWMEGEAVRRADRVIAISRGIGSLIRDHHGVPEGRIDLCPLGIELPDESQLVVDQDKDFLEVLFVGRLEKRKGIDTLFRAIPAVVNTMPDVQFTIVGSDTNTAALKGSYKKHLLKILNKKYHKNVNFVGFVSDDELKDYYRRCDLFVAPSLYESFGLIYLEAMAWGKPVIGCDVGGVPEVIADGETGIMVPPDDSGALADAIFELLVDEKKRRTLGKQAIEWMKKKYSKDVMVKNSLNLYLNKCNENDFIDIEPLPEGYKFQFDLFLEACNFIESYSHAGCIDPKDKICLDVGCGLGNMVLALKKYGARSVTGIDIDLNVLGSSVMDKIAQKDGIDIDGCKLIQGEVGIYPFIKESFDLIILYNVLEHVEKPEKLLSDLYKLLKKGGKLCISTAPLFYSPIGSHCWHIFPRNEYPWIHLVDPNFLDVLKEKDPQATGFYLGLNKITSSEILNIISKIGFTLEKQDLYSAPEKLEENSNYYNILKDIAPNCEDLTIEGINLILKK